MTVKVPKSLREAKHEFLSKEGNISLKKLEKAGLSTQVSGPQQIHRFKTRKALD